MLIEEVSERSFATDNVAMLLSVLNDPSMFNPSEVNPVKDIIDTLLNDFDDTLILALSEVMFAREMVVTLLKVF
jgi:hypothetical protein